MLQLTAVNEIFKYEYYIYSLSNYNIWGGKMKARSIIIIGGIVWIIGLIIFFSSPIVFVQTINPALFMMVASIGAICIFAGFITFFAGIVYWFITRPKKIMMVDGYGKPVQQQTVKSATKTIAEQTGDVPTLLFKDVMCYHCGHMMQLSKPVGTIVRIICPKCNEASRVTFK